MLLQNCIQKRLTHMALEPGNGQTGVPVYSKGRNSDAPVVPEGAGERKIMSE